MKIVVALLYAVAVVLLVIAWVRAAVVPARPSYGLCIGAAACALLAFSLPAIVAGFGGT